MRANRRKRKSWLARAAERLQERASSFTASVAVRARRWMSARCARVPRQLRVCETVSLGERRVLALVECREQTMLLAAAGNSVMLLSRLESRRDQEPVSPAEGSRMQLQ